MSATAGRGRSLVTDDAIADAICRCQPEKTKLVVLAKREILIYGIVSAFIVFLLIFRPVALAVIGDCLNKRLGTEF